MANATDETTAEDASEQAEYILLRDSFIGCKVRAEIKGKLWTMAVNAPGGARDLTWAINYILEQYFNKEQDG